jgi:hypothetical protein
LNVKNSNNKKGRVLLAFLFWTYNQNKGKENLSIYQRKGAETQRVIARVEMFLKIQKFFLCVHCGFALNVFGGWAQG